MLHKSKHHHAFRKDESPPGAEAVRTRLGSRDRPFMVVHFRQERTDLGALLLWEHCQKIPRASNAAYLHLMRARPRWSTSCTRHRSSWPEACFIHVTCSVPQPRPALRSTSTRGENSKRTPRCHVGGPRRSWSTIPARQPAIASDARLRSGQWKYTPQTAR